MSGKQKTPFFCTIRIADVLYFDSSLVYDVSSYADVRYNNMRLN
jgi:hypothetical protein